MPQGIKIATCCYCGTRAALTLRGEVRHELSCAACGAPLREMKRLPADTAGKPARPKCGPTRLAPAKPKAKPKAKPLKKRRKPLWRKALEEAVDLVEDLFD